jgi:predicted lipoprotein with Yx(FWY)xxD motif
MLHTNARFLRDLTVVSALALALLRGPAAEAQPAPSLATRAATDLGVFLTDQSGRTLYRYTKDDVGISDCNQACATAWPPLLTQNDPVLPPDLPGIVGTTIRSDGGVQVTYNGMPLYYWSKDQNPGDTTGQNVGGVWFVLNPSVEPASSLCQRAAATTTVCRPLAIVRLGSSSTTSDMPGLIWARRG